MDRVHAQDQVSSSYDVFRMEFDKKYTSNVVRDQKAAEFQQLVQGHMNVVDYKAKFVELSRYAPQRQNQGGRNNNRRLRNHARCLH